jgi:hypothetical protein
MRILLAVIAMVAGTGLAIAQSNTANDPRTQEDKVQGDSSHSTGRSSSPSTQGQAQPQGNTGPTNTTSGGAPAESPQGQTPPGMQSAPDGSSKTIVDEKK